MVDYSPRALGEEILIEGSVGWFLYFFRLYSRYTAHGLRAFGWDDTTMFKVMCIYTANLYMLYYIASGPGSSLFHPYELKYFSQVEIDSRGDGSKWVLVSEQCMLHIIWGCKTCLLYFYNNLTDGVFLRDFQRYLRAWVILGYLACQMAYFLQCRPFRGYWAVPPPKPDCTTFFSYAIVNAVTNISSDLIMLLVPVYVIGQAKLPLREQIGISFIFCLGIFVVVAALLTKVFNLSDEYDTLYMFWYARESSVAIYVANLPMIWPWVRRNIPFFRTDYYGPQKSHAKEKKEGGAPLKLLPKRIIKVVGGKTVIVTAEDSEDSEESEVTDCGASGVSEEAAKNGREVTPTFRNQNRVDVTIDSLFGPAPRRSHNMEGKDKDI